MAEKKNNAALASVLGKRAPKTRRGKKILRDREPKIVEDAKTSLVVRGSKCSESVRQLLQDLHTVRQPLSTLFMRKHPEHPFEDVGKLEHMCNKFDHGLFLFGSSSKKRPFRLIIGRLFQMKLLDMQEFNVDSFKSLRSFPASKNEPPQGSKPLMVFQGSAFETDERAKRAKSLLLDYFSGPRPRRIMVEGMSHVIVCSCSDGTSSSSKPALGTAATPPPISVTRYRVELLKSGSKLPRVELHEVGPRFRLLLDRTREPDRDRWKMSIKVPKAAKPTKVKNITTETMGKRKGKIHLGKQDFGQIHTVHHSKAKQRKLTSDLAAKKNDRV